MLFLSLKRNQKAKYLGQKRLLLCKKELLYDADWAAIACRLDVQSMLIAALFHVNKGQDDELKALNASNIY